MKKLLFLLLILSTSAYSQVNCPLNTPEFPFTTDDSFSPYSWSANLYTSTQMGGAQNLTSISFRLDNDACNGCATYTYTNCKIWVRNSAVTDYALTPGYPGTAGFTEVYSGNFTFSGPGVYTMNFNVAGSFNYDGTSIFEVLFENRGGVDNSWDEPWFDRTDPRTDGVYPGKVGWGSSWANATTISSNRLFNLQINGVACGAYTLPVTLSTSQLDCYENHATLSWSTVSEIDNDYFSIESSIDGVNWGEEIKINGQGNSQITVDYAVRIEKNIENETRYYRLSQTDFNGVRENLVVHSSDCFEKDIQFYPNPFTDEVRVLNFTEDNLEVYNQLGQIQKVLITTYDHTTTINMENLVSGIYFVIINGKGYRLIKK